MKVHEEVFYSTTLDFAVNPHPIEDRAAASFVEKALLHLRQKIDSALLVCQQSLETGPDRAARPGR